MRPRRSGVGSLGLSGSKAVLFKRGPSAGCVKDHPPFIHFPTRQVKEKLEEYKAEIAREKAAKSKELAKDVVSKGIEAAHDAAKAVPMPRAPGRDR